MVRPVGCPSPLTGKSSPTPVSDDMGGNSSPLAREELPPSDKSIVDEFFQEACEVFQVSNPVAQSLQYGLVVSPDNVHSKTYGWPSIYYDLKKKKKKISEKLVHSLSSIHGKEKRLYLYDLGLITEDEIMAYFDGIVFRQNNTSIVIQDTLGQKHAIKAFGRWTDNLGGHQVRKRLREVIGAINDPILLSLTVHQPLIENLMPDNTNLDPVQYSICHIGEWVRYFLRRLRQYQKNRNLEWRYYGWVLEFQGNGFPHVHIVMGGRWLGRIDEIASLWPYSESQGVDYMDKRKMGQKWGKGYTPLRLANYLTKYVSKSYRCVTPQGIHRGYAWLCFAGGRVFNVAHEKKSLTE